MKVLTTSVILTLVTAIVLSVTLPPIDFEFLTKTIMSSYEAVTTELENINRVVNETNQTSAVEVAGITSNAKSKISEAVNSFINQDADEDFTVDQVREYIRKVRTELTLAHSAINASISNLPPNVTAGVNESLEKARDNVTKTEDGVVSKLQGS